MPVCRPDPYLIVNNLEDIWVISALYVSSLRVLRLSFDSDISWRCKFESQWNLPFEHRVITGFSTEMNWFSCPRSDMRNGCLDELGLHGDNERTANHQLLFWWWQSCPPTHFLSSLAPLALLWAHHFFNGKMFSGCLKYKTLLDLFGDPCLYGVKVSSSFGKLSVIPISKESLSLCWILVYKEVICYIFLYSMKPVFIFGHGNKKNCFLQHFCDCYSDQIEDHLSFLYILYNFSNIFSTTGSFIKECGAYFGVFCHCNKKVSFRRRVTTIWICIGVDVSEQGHKTLWSSKYEFASWSHFLDCWEQTLATIWWARR